MRFRPPFTFLGIERLKKRPLIFKFLQQHKRDSKLTYYLENSDAGIDREHYLNLCIINLLTTLIVTYMLSTTALVIARVNLAYILSLGVALLFGIFVFATQLVYPKVYFMRKQRNLERNLMPGLEDMLVQLSSGVPLFNIMVNISTSDYGELSVEFRKAVHKINAGIPQIEVLEELGETNSSVYFRRALWQISNGMKSGNDISLIIKDSLRSLNEEQIVQIQNYGNKLNPLIMFYMLVTIILPALAVTFLTIISSMIGLGKNLTISMYMGMFGFVVLIQVMFLGIIRSSRPTLT
ncbi:MAG: type II secretion system F family protein [Candidatus Pacearchaeota archaeon]